MCEKYYTLSIKVIPEENETYASNSINVNGYIFIPLGFRKIKNQIEKKGFKVLEINVSEFRKIDGGLSCLSLRF